MRTLLGLVLIVAGVAVFGFVALWAAVRLILNTDVGEGLAALIFGGLFAVLMIWGGIGFIRRP